MGKQGSKRVFATRIISEYVFVVRSISGRGDQRRIAEVVSNDNFKPLFSACDKFVTSCKRICAAIMQAGKKGG